MAVHVYLRSVSLCLLCIDLLQYALVVGRRLGDVEQAVRVTYCVHRAETFAGRRTVLWQQPHQHASLASHWQQGFE